MLFAKIVFVVVLSAPLGLFASPIDTKSKRLQWKCENLCQKSGGKAMFDLQSKKCKCKFGRSNFDGAEFNKNVKLIKREIQAQTEDTEPVPANPEVPVSEPAIIQSTSESAIIVGQQHTPGTTTRKPSSRTPARLRERTISQDQQKLIIQQIRDHLNRIPQLNDQRGRQLEIEAIRTYLKQLSASSIAQNPQQRSRLRNVVEEARKQRLSQRLMKPHLVGISLGKNADNVGKTKSGSLKEKVEQQQQPHFEIITQDPSLVDE